jgi:hypothetical protein
MDCGTFDALARHIGTPQNRRTSLKALSAAGLGAALAAPIGTAAKNKKCKKKVQQKCSGQIAACQAATNAFCGEGDPDCQDALLPCCDLLADCDAGSAVTCIVNAFPIHG